MCLGAFSGIVWKVQERAFLVIRELVKLSGFFIGSGHVLFVAEIHRSRRNANDSPYSIFLVGIAESVLVEVALVMCHMGKMLQGQEKFDVVDRR